MSSRSAARWPLSRATRRAGRRSGTPEYFAELIDEWAPEGHADERLYRLGVVGDRRAGRRRRRPSRSRATSSSGCCGCRGLSAVVGLPGMRSAFDGGAVMPPREHHFLCRRCAPAAGGTLAVARGHAIPASGAAAAPDALGAVPLDAGAARELETAHRRLINMHLEKELKSVRVLRQLGVGAAKRPLYSRSNGHAATAHLQTFRVLGVPRVPAPAAAGHRNGGGHDASGDVPARARSQALERRLRAALPSSGGRPVRRESESAVQAPSVSGDPQAGAGRSAAAVSAEPRGLRDRSARARRPLRGGQLGVADARRLGHRLAGAVRRAGDHAVHVFPAGGRYRPGADRR